MATIGVYGQSAYGFSVYSDTVLRKIITNLTARRGVEGPQIILTWDKPEEYMNVDNIRIVRKMGSFPLNETDGKILLTTSNTELEQYTDFPGYGPEYFYYKIFSESSSVWYSTRLAEVVELAHDTISEKQDKFFTELDDIHRALDKARFGVNEIALTPNQDLDVYEKILLAEDGQTLQGELRRFLKLFNLFYSEPLALLRAIATRDGMGVVHDPQRTSPQNLFYFAQQYGWAFNFDLPVDAARAEVLNIVDTYRKKGRKDKLEEILGAILTGHTVTIVNADEVIDFNDYPDSSFLDTTDLIGEVNWLTVFNSIYVLADLTNDSTIGFNKVIINIVPNDLLMIAASAIQKIQALENEFFNVLDDVFQIIHITFNVTYPTDFTTNGQAKIGAGPFPDPVQIDEFDSFKVGEGNPDWDLSTTPAPSPGDLDLIDPKFTDNPRNVVYLDGSDNPTTTPTKKTLVRCFMDLETFTSLYCREAGLFATDGSMLINKNMPLRFVNAGVRFVVDWKITWP